MLYQYQYQSIQYNKIAINSTKNEQLIFYATYGSKLYQYQYQYQSIQYNKIAINSTKNEQLIFYATYGSML